MAQNKHVPRRKHVPQRTCIACREVAGKRGLIRLVRTGDVVEVDLTGKKPGRGAYIHPLRSCWEAALRSNRIEQAFRIRLSADNRAALVEFAAAQPEVDEEETEQRYTTQESNSQ